MKQVDLVATGLPSETSLLATYIASDRTFRGIGPRRAAALAEALGDDLQAAILALDKRVIEIVGEEPAIEAAAAMEARQSEVALLSWLDDIGAQIPTANAIRLARAWGPQGIEAVRQNPYLLLSVTSWKAVDAIARSLGIDDSDTRRDAAAVEAVLTGDACLGVGSTRLTVQRVLCAAAHLLGRPAAAGAAQAAVASGGAARFADTLQPPGTAHMEAECALKLTRLSSARPVLGVTPSATLNTLLAAYEAGQPFPLTKAQREAVRMSHRHRLMVLAGYAGSGKTTVLRGVCETMEAVGRRPLIVTLSGRAAKRAAEATSRRAITVTRFLLEADRPLSANTALIADEASMLGLVELWRILRRIGDASLLLCGDPAQLPPVTPGIVFHQLATDHEVARVILDRVHRQDETTGIPALAEGVRNGTLKTLSTFEGAQSGVTFTPCEKNKLTAAIHAIGRVLAESGMGRDDVQIIAPTNRDIAAINGYFHRLAMQRRPVAWPRTAHVAEGEPVIWTRNDADRGLTNGSMGRILRVRSDSITANLDGNVHELAPIDGSFLQLAYAVSVHKAQGSQWQRVIVPVFASRILDRSMIYTALTRAQEQVIFLGDRRALDVAVRRPPAAERREVGFGDWLTLTRAKSDNGQRDNRIAAQL
ncbi:exodeoxyribonuclease V alpha subunit [Palleronia salina]|uniref:Exodeoxyribonuclease V alpha subunit n=1 Tax=Palleronia salina TaxID=313368 RepID=A0A1M6GSU7_9RHOB|nr:AAA family ATPase [Palleronia salina]SHJ12986.1 exodeoxyribonuclease V alpha subunit [Palleronia salina]